MTWRKLTGLLPGVALAEVALALVTSAAGILLYRGFFATLDYLPVLALACLVGGVTAVVGHRRAWTTLALAVAGLALVIVYGVFGGAGSAVLSGVRGSWNRLLTVAVPADPWGELLVVPVIVVWAVTFSAVALALRTRNVLAPLAPPLAGFLFAVFIVGNQAGGHAIATVVFLVAAMAMVAIRAHRSTGSGTVRIERRSSRPIGALIVVGLMVAASALFGVVGGQVLPLASGEHRFDLRDVLAPPVTNTDTITPLSQLKRQLNEVPPRTLFTVRINTEVSSNVDRVRTAALDMFDGTTWTSADTYRVAGSHLTVDPALTRGQPVSARIELKELSGPHLPVIGWPSRLSANGDTEGRFGFDASSGVVVSTTPNLQGLTYDVTGEITARDDGLARAVTTTEHPRDLPDGMPEPLRELSEEFTGLNGYERLVALEARLRSIPMRLDRPPGHSYAAIARMLTSGDSADGFAEQHASAFTVLARALGFPARVAVGYRLRNYQSGAFHVSTADAHAWSEVHFAGYGWVVFEPSRPDYGSLPNPPSEAPRVVPPRPAPSTTALAAAPPTSSQSEAAEEQGFGWNNLLRGTALVVPALVVLLVLTCGYIAIAKAHRRRRRRLSSDHAAQVLGAWHEQIDRLTERGITPPVSLTFQEVAEHVRGSLGDAADPIRTSAELATTAVYAPEHLDRSEAEQAWQLVARLHTELYPRRMSAARLRAAVDPRPLWAVWTVQRQRRQAREGLEMGRYR